LTGGANPPEIEKMTTPANRWLLIGALSALAIGMSACNKPAATDTANATADASAAPPADTGNTMSADNSMGANTTSSGGAAPSQ
jgi:hypothetical protein